MADAPVATVAQPRPTLGCARCGDCCDPVVMPPDFDPMAIEPTPGSRAVADLTFIRQHWTRQAPREGDTDSHWACDRFDRQERACTAYGERPPVCQGFPWYLDGPTPERAGRLAHPRCSYLFDVPPEQRPQGARPLIPVEVIRG
jgi:Fe-S-cluster containining protein